MTTYTSRRQRLQTRAHRHSVDLDRYANTARNISSGIMLQASAMIMHICLFDYGQHSLIFKARYTLLHIVSWLDFHRPHSIVHGP